MAIGSDNRELVPGQEAALRERAAGIPLGGFAAPGAQQSSTNSMSSSVDDLSLVTLSTQYYARDRALLRKKTAFFALLIVLVVGFSLCVGVSDYFLIYSPLDVLACYVRWFQINIASIFLPSLSLLQYNLLDDLPMYYEVVTRGAYTLITFLCGGLLALSGMLYQNAFRNPIAGPTMLGVSGGVSVAYVILVLLYGAAALSMPGARFLYCFAGGAVVLLIVLLLGKLSSGRQPLNMVNVLLVATIVSTLLNNVVNYYANYLFTEEQWSVYYELTNITDLDTSVVSMVVLVVATVAICLPVFIFRFPLNCIAFGEEDMRLFGINPFWYRALALICGSLMIVVAQVYTGAVAMASLVVPFASRAVFGTEFRKQMLGNVLIGALLLLVCRLLISFIPFVGDGIPLGTMVSTVTLPAFVWVMVIAQKQWRD